MIKVKVFGATPPCAKCRKVTERAAKVAEKYLGKVEVVHLDALSDEGEKYGILLTPTIVVNEKVVSIGKVPSEDEIDHMIKKEIEKQP